MASRLVETVQAKMADYFSFFSRPNVTRMQIFHSTFNNRTDFRMQNFELACTFSDCETAILYPKDFNLTKLLNAILSFDFITLLKSFWFPQALLTFRLSSDVCLLKRSWIMMNEVKYGNKRVNKEYKNSLRIVKRVDKHKNWTNKPHFSFMHVIKSSDSWNEESCLPLQTIF